MKISFIASTGTKFIVTGQPTEPSSLVSTEYIPSTSDLEEYVEWVREERAVMERGPQVVRAREKATLLVNGGSFRVERDPEVPRGYMWIRDAEGRLFEVKLEREGRAEREGPALLVASGGADAAGDAVASETV